MIQPAPAVRPAAWDSSVAAKVLAIAESEFHKLRHDPVEMITRAAQPTLWLVVFGQAMARLRAVPTGPYSYLQFLAPGILAQSVVFIAIFFGIAIIWERDMGVLQKLLVTPTPRYALVVGKMISAGIRATGQAAIVFLLAWIMRIQLHTGPIQLAGCLLAVILGAAFFSALSMVFACMARTRERFMGIGQVITMPLFFASDALYPIAIMPNWLKLLARINPLSYLVDCLRTLLVGGATAAQLATDYGVLLLAAALAAAVCSRLYPRLA